MMTGNNSLRLNTATMIVIVQEWIDREMTHPPKVSTVEYDAQLAAFIVKTENAKPAPA